MGRLRLLSWSFDDERDLAQWMAGKEVFLTGDVRRYSGSQGSYLQVSFVVDEYRHAEILGLTAPLDEDDWED